MLEFIVLGQIPGTSIQITFEQVVMTVALLCISFELHQRLKKHAELKTADNS